MKANLLGLFDQATGSDFEKRLSIYLDEDLKEIKKAMAIIVPAVLSAFIEKTAKKKDSEMLLHFIQFYASAHFSLPIESRDQLQELISLGAVVLNNLGQVQITQKEVPETLIPLSKLRIESVEALTRTTGCVFKELIFREILDNDLDVEELSDWLQSQETVVQQAREDAEQLIFSSAPDPSTAKIKTRKKSGPEGEHENKPFDFQSNILLDDVEPMRVNKVIRLLILAAVSIIILYFIRPEQSSVESTGSSASPIPEDSAKKDNPAVSPSKNDSLILDN